MANKTISEYYEQLRTPVTYGNTPHSKICYTNNCSFTPNTKNDKSTIQPYKPNYEVISVINDVDIEKKIVTIDSKEVTLKYTKSIITISRNYFERLVLKNTGKEYIQR